MTTDPNNEDEVIGGGGAGDDADGMDWGNGGDGRSGVTGLGDDARDALLQQAIDRARREYPFCAPAWAKVTPASFRNRGRTLGTLTAILKGYGAVR